MKYKLTDPWHICQGLINHKNEIMIHFSLLIGYNGKWRINHIELFNVKYIYWLIVSSLIYWEMSQLKVIFEFPTFWQYLITIGLVVYFGYLFDLKVNIHKFKKVSVNRAYLNNEQ